MSYEFAMGTAVAEEPQVAVATPIGQPVERQPEPTRLEFEPLTPNLPTNVGNFVQQFTGSEYIGEVANCTTTFVVPVSSRLSVRSALTWPTLVPWVAALLMYRHRMKQGSEKDEALKSGAKMLFGLSVGLCTIGRAIMYRLIPAGVQY